MRIHYPMSFVITHSGAYMAFNVQQEEYLNISPAAGMVLSVNSPNEPVIPQEMGDYIAPGFFTQLVLTRVRFKRIVKDRSGVLSFYFVKKLQVTFNRINTPRSVCVSNVSELAPSTPYYYYYYSGAYSPEVSMSSILRSVRINIKLHMC